jgi:diketogulonate reductase-like aldo/keto reductase
MKYETIHDLQIPKIGFGTWKIGGEYSPDLSKEAQSLAAIRSAIELGYTHFDTAEMYANGYTEELLERALRETDTERAHVFITSKVAPEHLQFDEVLKACDRSLRRLNTDYLDLYLVHWPNERIPLEDTFRAMNKLVNDGRARRVGVSNFDLRLLKQAQDLSETPILTDQVPYSLADRRYAQDGVVEYCRQNNILLTAYSPVKRVNESPDQTLKTIAEAHSATPHQIALAWLVAQGRVITIPKSLDPKRQAENMNAADIDLTADEIKRLNGIQ